MKIKNLVASIALVALAAAGAQADPFTLSNGGTTAAGDFGGAAGTAAPTLLDTFSSPSGTGVTDHLFENHVYIDSGAGSISLVSLPVVAQTATATTLDVAYDGGDFQVNLVYDLDATGTLNETITISALNPVSLRVWDFSDFDVDGSAGTDTVAVESASRISQSDGLVTLVVDVTAPVPSAFEVRDFAGGLEAAVVAGTDLNNTDTGVASADNTFAFQWNFELAASETVAIIKTRGFGAAVATGACVVASACNDDCSVQTADACATAGGTYLGDDTACPAPDATGACCLVDSCIITCASDCTAQSGTYLGDGSDCGLGGVNLPIDDTLTNPVSDAIAVGDSVVVADVEVSLTLAHTWAADLDITLTSPLGTVIDLAADNGTGGANLGTGVDGTAASALTYTFSDDGVGTWTDGGDPVAPGDYAPLIPLVTFAGEDSLGGWTLTITDDATGDNGFWVDWTITINGVTYGNPSEDPCADTGCACEFGGASDVVNVEDLLSFLALWFAFDAAADINGGGVDVTDLLEFLACWFPASADGNCN